MSGLHHFNPSGDNMSKVVQIIAGKSVPYSLNNVNVLEFDDKQFYEVPDHVADGMIARKWAKLASDEDIAAMADGGQPGQGDDPNPKPPPVQEPGKEPPKPQPQPDENGDDDDGENNEGREDARQALRTKGKRR